MGLVRVDFPSDCVDIPYNNRARSVIGSVVVSGQMGVVNGVQGVS